MNVYEIGEGDRSNKANEIAYIEQILLYTTDSVNGGIEVVCL